MSQSLSRVVVHLIFSTKLRKPVLTEEIREELIAYLIGILRNQGCQPIMTNAEREHVHSLFLLSKNHALADIVEEVKKGSSKWLKTKGAFFYDFHWQGGYGAFSVGEDQIEEVKRYIANQQEHHTQVSFQDELRALLKKHGIPFDERYIWD
ncbi:MAG: IS200/IS605 family transposase [Armatimonadota bacterium]